MAQRLISEIAVVVVNRNAKEMLRKCLESLSTGFLDIPYDVWVVDNASEDGSADMVAQDFSDVHLIRNDENLGFAKANNQALKRTEAPFALLLNSDAILTEGCIAHLYNFLVGHPEVAIVGPRLLYEDGRLQPSTYPLPGLWEDLLTNLKLYKALPKRMKSRMFLGSFWDHDDTRSVGRITGACVLVKTDDLRAVNFLDEGFFFYGEIHDLCWTLWERGRETWLNPDSVVIHLGGQSSKKMWTYKEQRRRMWSENERLLRKHQGSNTVRLGIFLNWLGLLFGTVKERAIGSPTNTSIDGDLLKVDFEWHSRRIKEWLWFKCRPFLNVYFERRSYSRQFRKRLIDEFHIANPSCGEFEGEAKRIEEVLINKWNEAQDSWGRTGIMAFSCSRLLYHIVRLLKPRVVVETGVANGASSTFILSAMAANGIGRLYSIDWSGSGEASFVPDGRDVGWMVPDKLRKRWHTQIGRSEEKLQGVLRQIGIIDIFLHDSDHSYETMMYEYKAAWPHLKCTGLLLSDDVRMNTAFDEFTKDTKSPTMVYKGRLGIAQKIS